MLQAVINIDSLMRGDVCMVNCTVDGRTCCSHCSSHRSIVKNRDLCHPMHLHSTPCYKGPRRSIAMTFGMDKLERFVYRQ